MGERGGALTEEMQQGKHHHLDGVSIPAVHEDMIEGRQRDQGYRRCAQH